MSKLTGRQIAAEGLHGWVHLLGVCLCTWQERG